MTPPAAPSTELHEFAALLLLTENLEVTKNIPIERWRGSEQAIGLRPATTAYQIRQVEK